MDTNGRLLWTGSGRGFAHGPVSLIRRVLCSDGQFAFEAEVDDGFSKCYRRMDSNDCEQKIIYGKTPSLYLQNFPLALVAKLGMLGDLPV